MNLDYLRSRATQYLNARSMQERLELLTKLAWHLNVIRAGESAGLEDQQHIFDELGRLGINVSYRYFVDTGGMNMVGQGWR